MKSGAPLIKAKTSLFLLSFLLLVGSVSAALTDNIWAAYSFDTDGTDDTGNGNTLTNTGATADTGVNNGAFYYGGPTEDDYFLRDTAPSNIGISSFPFSASAWVNFDDVAENMVVLGFFDGSSGVVYNDLVWVGSTQYMYIRSRDSGASISSFAAITVEPESWHHIVGVWTSTGMHLYVDGVYHNTDNTRAGSIGTVIDRLSVGRAMDASPGVELTGIIDEVYVWDRQLTDGDCTLGNVCGGEIAELYNSGSGLFYDFTSGGWTNTPPSITINSPADNYHTNDDTPSFNITVTDADGNTSDCTLRVNGSITATSTGVASGSTIILTSTALSEDVHTWTITCDDGDATVTTNRTIIIDTTNPIFTLNSIQADNSTRIVREENVTYWFNDSWSDTYMYAYQHYLFAPNGSQMKAWNATALTSTFVWTNSSYDFTNAPLGTWNYSVTGSDDHTAREWDPDDVIITNQYIRFYKDEAWVQIENEQGNLRSIDYNCDDYEDRCGFSFEPNNNRREWNFRLSSSQRLNYRGELYEYPTFVATPMWVDFVTNSPRVQSMSVTPDDDDMIITVTMDRNKNERIVFESIGGLNIVSKNYSFDIVANNPPNVTLAFTVDPVFETQNEVASAYYTDVENHTGVINWYWYVNAISVFNETTNNVLNATTRYSTLLKGNYSATDTISLTINAYDGYNHTVASDDIVVSTTSSGTGGTKIILIQRNCFLFWC